jgi:hypothetical protein
MTAEEVLRLHVDGFNRALTSGNHDALEHLYSDAYMLVRADGSVLNKSQVLQDLREHGLTFESIDIDETKVRLLGSAAILTGRSRTVSSRSGKTARTRSRFVAAYASERDATRLVHFQSTPLPDE